VNLANPRRPDKMLANPVTVDNRASHAILARWVV
jgi:hypothetical protein